MSKRCCIIALSVYTAIIFVLLAWLVHVNNELYLEKRTPSTKLCEPFEFKCLKENKHG